MTGLQGSGVVVSQPCGPTCRPVAYALTQVCVVVQRNVTSLKLPWSGGWRFRHKGCATDAPLRQRSQVITRTVNWGGV